MTTYKAPSNQPYSVLLHRNGNVEVVYGQPQQQSHSRSTSREHASVSVPKASPRSTAATFGSTNTRIASTTAHRDSSASGNSPARHLVPESSSHHHHHHHSSESHRNTSGHSGHHLVAPTSGERHRHHSTSSTERPSVPIPIPAPAQSQSRPRTISHTRSRSHTPSPQSSPKQTRFVLPSTSPQVTSSGHLLPPTAHHAQAPVVATPHRSPQRHSSALAVPTSRHRPSSSAESFFFLQSQPHRPKGWYNRRGDRYVGKGLVERPAAHLQWHPTFKDYPEHGFMDENGHFMPAAGGILKN